MVIDDRTPVRVTVRTFGLAAAFAPLRRWFARSYGHLIWGLLSCAPARGDDRTRIPAISGFCQRSKKPVRPTLVVFRTLRFTVRHGLVAGSPPCPRTESRHP